MYKAQALSYMKQQQQYKYKEHRWGLCSTCILKIENKHRKSESYHPCLPQLDKTISEVKLTVKFYTF